MDMDNESADPFEDPEHRPRSVSQPETQAPSIYGFDTTVRECGSEPVTIRREVEKPPGATSRSQPPESSDCQSLAHLVSQSIIRYGLQEAAYMSFSAEERARLCSPMLSSAGTWASISEDIAVPRPQRVYPGCQLESLETTPLGSATGKDSVVSSACRNREPVRLPVFETWCTRVLRQLHEEARNASSEMRRTLESLTPEDIARIFGVLDWNRQAEEAQEAQEVQEAQEAEAQEVLDSDQEDTQERLQGESSNKNEGGDGGYVPPVIPRLNLENIQREIDEDYDDDDEDFVNKVGSEAVGVANSIPKTHEVKASNVPPLSLTSIQGQVDEHSDFSLPISGSKSTISKRKPGLLPLAEVFKRKSRRDLSMYCDDLTLMLLKQRPKAKKALPKSKSAIQLPPLHKPPPIVAQPQAPVFMAWQPQVVHDHFHYHFHVPS